MEIPKDILEKAVEGGWRPTFFSLPHLHPNRGSEEIVLDPAFWVALCKSQGFSQEEINMCVGCGRAARHNEDISFHKCPKCGDSLYRYDGQWLIEMHRLIDAIAENKVAQMWAGWKELLDTK